MSTGPPDDQLDQISLWSYVMVDSGRRGHFPTCNIAYRREVLDAVKGFDERFQYRRPDRSARCMIGDDTDFAWSAIDMGFRPGYAPDAVVYHDVFPQSWQQYASNMRRLEGLVLMCKKHPELGPYLGRRWIYFRSMSRRSGSSRDWRGSRRAGSGRSSPSARWEQRGTHAST